jgi:tRNA pseudouridine32 synthase/23S rRNA pseudouridine746 synthase
LSDQVQPYEHHRWVLEEPDIPFDMQVLYEDQRIIVVDKPHFLPTTPRGMWYRSSALMRLREQYHNVDITPAHRLDRSTAGIVVFVKEPSARGAYQMLFQRRAVRKTYECIAPARVLIPTRFGVNVQLNRPSLFPMERISHIDKDRGIIQAYESAGEANSRTVIAISCNQQAVLAANEDALAMFDKRAATRLLRVYQLHPYSGKTHQLRVHMSALGLPILGDDLYPTLNMRATDDFSQPLQLVARSLEFKDPYSGLLHRFTSQIPLQVSDDAVGAHD